MSTALWILASYLLGATPTSYLAGQMARGIDLRDHGSKNLGATNVYRLLGWKYAIPVALWDMAKGGIPVLLYVRLSEVGQQPWLPWMPVALGGAAVLGHMFSPYMRFRGGKGVATAAGVFVALAPLALAIALPVWGASLWLTGYVSLSSIVAALTFPVWVRLTTGSAGPTFWASVVLALLIVVAHRANIQRLVAGTENRFRTRGQVTG